MSDDSTPQPIPISVIVLTKNEEAGIATTLVNLRAFDDVVVVDSASTDRTVELSEEAGARVVQFAWNGGYPKKKQWALENAGAIHDWILLLDADERPSPELLTELRAKASEFESKRFGGYDILLSYQFAGRFLKHGHRVTKRSLLHRDHSRFPVVDDLDAPGIREVEGHYQPEVDGPIGSLRGRILHDDQDPIRSWFDRHNRYSDWEAYLALRNKLKADIASKRSAKGRIFDKVPFKPVLFFGYSYIARLGFLDGRAGLDYALALSGYYWQIGVKIREVRRRDAGKHGS